MKIEKSEKVQEYIRQDAEMGPAAAKLAARFRVAILARFNPKEGSPSVAYENANRAAVELARMEAARTLAMVGGDEGAAARELSELGDVAEGGGGPGMAGMVQIGERGGVVGVG